MKQIAYIITFCSLLVIMSFTFVGEFFSSMTKAEYMEGAHSLKFTTKMNAAHAAEAVKINQNAPNFDSELQRYVGRNFDVAVNGAQQQLTFTGSQVKGESVWIYFEIGGINEIKILKVRNALLMDVYPSQNNILNVAYKGKQKTMSFQRGRDTGEIGF